MSLVSVVIPVHNGGAALRRAIASVLAQSHDELEVIVVDDGSTDDSVSIARSFTDDRLRVVSRPVASGGPADPRNDAISTCRGEWVAFLDHDDEWLPDKLRLQLADADDDRALMYSRCLLREDEDAKPVDYHEYFGFAFDELPAGDCARLLIDGNFVPVLTALVRRSWATRIGLFDPSLGAVEDYDYWLRVSLGGGRFGATQEPTAVYNRRPGSLSRTVEAWEVRARMFHKLAHQHPLYAAQLRGRERRAFAHVARRRFSLAARSLRSDASGSWEDSARAVLTSVSLVTAGARYAARGGVAAVAGTYAAIKAAPSARQTTRTRHSFGEPQRGHRPRGRAG